MSGMDRLLSLSPQEFVEFLKSEKIFRFHLVFDAENQVVKSSHPQLMPLADFIQSDTGIFCSMKVFFFRSPTTPIPCARSLRTSNHERAGSRRSALLALRYGRRFSSRRPAVVQGDDP